MLKIRLTRMGKKHAPAYRIVVTEKRSKRDGKYIDQLGYYHPSTNPLEFKLDQDKYKKWLANGAQPSTGLKKVLDQQNVNL